MRQKRHFLLTSVSAVKSISNFPICCFFSCYVKDVIQLYILIGNCMENY